MKKVKGFLVGGIGAVTMLAALLVSLLLLPMSVQAETNGIYTYTVSNGEATITAVDTSISGDITIPSTLDGYTVTSIGRSAFEGCTSLTEIIIPDSVTSIGRSAFEGCTGLTSVTIGKGVTGIDKGAFRDCTGLEEINFNATAMKVNYYYGTFENAGKSGNGITVNIGANVTEVPAYLFFDFESSCTPKITTVTFAENSVCESIDGSAFYGCISLQSITIPKSVTSIGSSAFSGCSGLTDIIIPASVTSIGESAFFGCAGLESIQVEKENPVYHSAGDCLITTSTKTLTTGCKNSVIPTDGSVTSIGESAFFGCTGLMQITIPASVTSIGSSAFYGCSGLSDIIIPAGVTSIDGSAFYGCISLQSITIPKSVTSIGYAAFDNCTNLKDVWYTGAPSEKESIVFSSRNTDLTSATWHYNVCGKHITTIECNVNCTICGYKNTLEHIYSSDCDAICNRCSQERNVTGAHSYSNNCDETCNVCGAVRTELQHTYNGGCDPDCAICGYTREVVHDISDAWVSDGINHYHECSICGLKEEEAPHEPGAEATEFIPQTCTICGRELAAALGHSFSDAWSADAEGHWHECACGEKGDLAKHTYEDGICSVCGAEEPESFLIWIIVGVVAAAVAVGLVAAAAVAVVVVVAAVVAIVVVIIIKKKKK